MFPMALSLGRPAGRTAGREFKKHPLPTTHSLRECNKLKLTSSFTLDFTFHNFPPFNALSLALKILTLSRYILGARARRLRRGQDVSRRCFPAFYPTFFGTDDDFFCFGGVHVESHLKLVLLM